MQPSLRGESRSRRPPSLDPSASSHFRPPRARRVPSSSRIDLHPLLTHSASNSTAISTAPSTSAPTPAPSSTISPSSAAGIQASLSPSHSITAASPPPPLHPLPHAALQTVAYLTLSSMQRTNPSLPLPLLILSPFLTAALLFLLLSRTSFRRPRAASSSSSSSSSSASLSSPSVRAALAPVTLLLLGALICLHFALTSLGAIRVLVAFAVHPTLARLLAALVPHWLPRVGRQRNRPPPLPVSRLALAPLFLTTVAVVLLVHDVAGGRASHAGHVARVRERVLRNPTARLVHDGFRNFSSRVSHSLYNQSLPSVHFPTGSDRPLRHLRRLRQLQKQRQKQRPSQKQEPQSNPPRKLTVNIPSTSSGDTRQSRSRRKLLTIVAADGNDHEVKPPQQPAPPQPPTQPIPQKNSSLINSSTVQTPPPSPLQSTSNENTNSSHFRDGNARTIPSSSDSDGQKNHQRTLQQTQKAQRSPARNASLESTDSSSTSSLSSSASSQRLVDESSADSLQDNVALVTDRSVSPLSPLRAFFAVMLAAVSPLVMRIATDFSDRLVVDMADPFSFVSWIFFLASVITSIWALPVLLLSSTWRQQSHDLVGIIFRGILVALCLFVLPFLGRLRLSGAWRRGYQPRMGRNGTVSRIVPDVALLELATAVPSAPWLYGVTMVSVAVTRILGWTTVPKAESSSFFSSASALVMLVVSQLERLRAQGRTYRDSSLVRGRASGDSSRGKRMRTGVFLRLSFLAMRRWAKVGRDGVVGMILALTDLWAHARTNRASWQVLNFLILQSGMAIVELVYASATHASGLFSISADNFFCSVALAIGLLAIRVSGRKPTLEFSYGFSRVESICGFANGVMLIYVAMLIVLEAVERTSIGERAAIGRAFSVCLFGIVGNGLGLYFFPPETRRESHNVQGIYLHILCNTLAFATVAVSATVSAVVPEWRVVDIGLATVVGLGVVGMALPLMLRSGRVLILMLPGERRRMLPRVEEKLRAIGGVYEVGGLRVWDVTPNYTVASVRLVVLEGLGDDGEAEVLSHARSVFAGVGVASSQCTIQISRRDDDDNGADGSNCDNTRAEVTSVDGAVYYYVTSANG